MFNLKHIFHRRSQGHAIDDSTPDSDYQASGERGHGLEVEFQRLIEAQFHRWGVALSCISIEVRKIGTAADGYDVFVAMVRLMKWHRFSGLRVLLGLPLLEAKIRSAVRGTWLADHAHFVGLWLHSSEHLHDSEGLSELRDMLKEFAPHPAAHATLPHPEPKNVSSMHESERRLDSSSSPVSVPPFPQCVDPGESIPGIVVKFR